MDVLMLSTDRSAFQEGSAVRARFARYGELCESLHIVVFTKQGYRTEVIAPNVFLHPTNSRSRWGYALDAVRIGTALPKPELVTAQDPFEVGFAGWRLARRHGARLELQIHTDFLSPYFARHSVLNRLRVRIARFLLPKADGIRVVSSRIKESLERARYPLKVAPSVLPIWSDVERIMAAVPQFSLKERYPGFDFIVLTVSRLEKEKNVMLGLQAMARVIREYPHVGYIVAGEGSEKLLLERAAANLGIAGNVRFVGWQGNTASFYKGADLYLSTSDYEGYGLSLAEAALSGCPIVATDAGITGSLLGHDQGALVCPQGDVLCLSKEVKRAINDPELRKKLKRTALASLLVALPKDEGTYYAGIVKGWRAAVERKKRLLILTQKIDRKDTVLGFFHRWTEEFAKHYERLSVVCLYEGEHRLPPNVKVFSLGKELRVSRLSYVLNFYGHIWRLRHEYDTVFVHMNQEYVLLGALLWKVLGKRVLLWRNHYAGGLLTDIAVWLSDAVFCTSRYSYTARFKKTIFMPVGIDTAMFAGEMPRKKNSILSLSRISPSKRLEVILEALAEVKKKNIPFSADFYGDAAPSDEGYLNRLKSETKRLGLEGEVSFHPGVPNDSTPAVYAAHEIFINASPSGMYDKTIFEAMASGTLPLTSNENLKGKVGDIFLFEENNPESLFGKIENLFRIELADRERYDKELREFVMKNHSLGLLASRLSDTV